MGSKFCSSNFPKSSLRQAGFVCIAWFLPRHGEDSLSEMRTKTSARSHQTGNQSFHPIWWDLADVFVRISERESSQGPIKLAINHFIQSASKRAAGGCIVSSSVGSQQQWTWIVTDHWIQFHTDHHKELLAVTFIVCLLLSRPYGDRRKPIYHYVILYCLASAWAPTLLVFQKLELVQILPFFGKPKPSRRLSNELFECKSIRTDKGK